MRIGTWFVGVVGVAVAGLLASAGGGLPDVGNFTPGSIRAGSISNAATAGGNAIGIHWPSFFTGAIIGVALTFISMASWFELPQRIFRWLIANERNFYRLGMAAVCLAVLLFY